MAIALTKQPSSNHARDMNEQWRTEYNELQEKHQDLERDYWMPQGQ